MKNSDLVRFKRAKTALGNTYHVVLSAAEIRERRLLLLCIVLFLLLHLGGCALTVLQEGLCL